MAVECMHLVWSAGLVDDVNDAPTCCYLSPGYAHSDVKGRRGGQNVTVECMHLVWSAGLVDDVNNAPASCYIFPGYAHSDVKGGGVKM